MTPRRTPAVRPSGAPAARRAVAAAVAGAALVFALPRSAPAQGNAESGGFRPRVQWEVRVDAIRAADASLQVGAGANVPAGYYLRFAANAAAGPLWDHGTMRTSARADLAARYLLDPFHEVPWALYGGAGLSARWDERAHWQGFLLLVGGVEGPDVRGWRVAFEAGLGGGARLGVALRRARTNGR